MHQIHIIFASYLHHFVSFCRTPKRNNPFCKIPFPPIIIHIFLFSSVPRISAGWKISTSIKYSEFSFSQAKHSSASWAFHAFFPFFSFPYLLFFLFPKLSQLFKAFLVHHTIVQRTVSAFCIDMKMLRNIR